jgi:DNA-binding PadR family transcriptional regulator
MASREYTPLAPRTFYVLLALAERDSHGLAIAKAVESMTQGAMRLTAGSLYPLIHQLVVDAWITEIDDPSGDPRRRCYRLTPTGRRVAQTEAQRLASLVRLAQSFRLLPAGSLA